VVTYTPAEFALDRLVISIKWVITPLGLQLSAIRFGEPEHTGSRIRIRTAGRCGFGFRTLIVGLYYKFVVSTSVSGGAGHIYISFGAYIYPLY